MTKKKIKAFAPVLKVGAALVLVLAVGCARERAQPLERTFVPRMADGENRLSGELAPVKSSLEEGVAGACHVLESLRTSPSNRLRYSFFKELDLDRKEGKGSIAIATSPFTQYVLGETFKVGSTEEFLAKAKEEHEAGRLSGIKWALVNAARLIPSLLRSLQFSTTNSKLEEAFPGIFGESGDIESSLFWSLAKKTKSIQSDDRNAIASVLAGEMPLFSSDRWEEAARDVQYSLGGAISSLSAKGYSQLDRRERLCGLVLWHRAMAQLLALKGYNKPLMVRSKASPAHYELKKISGDQPEFVKQGQPGAFNVVLTSSDIKNYDPGSRSLTVSARLPNGRHSEGGGLEELLSYLESAVYLFEATSPAAPWFEGGERYLLGDIRSKAGPAILPADSNILALGLVTMGLKNLAFHHILKVNAQGASLGEGEAAAGMVLVDTRAPEGDRVVIRIGQMSRLIRTVTYLDSALGNFTSHPADHWEKIHPSYDRKLLAQLLGRAMFDESELEAVLSPSERESVLKVSLNRLFLPLVLLASEMTDGRSACISEMEWNLQTGAREALKGCNAEQEAEFNSAMNLLSEHTQAPLIRR